MHGPSAGYNLIHVKPSITFKVSPKVTLITARVFQWHAIAADAIYSQGMAVVPGTEGERTRWNGMYGQVRADWLVSSSVAPALEAVRSGLRRILEVADRKSRALRSARGGTRCRHQCG
jgi:hypothetical protein